MKRALSGLAALVLAAGCTYDKCAVKQPAAIVEPIRAAYASDIDYSSTSIDGKVINPQDYQGKIVVLVCGGTWCGPCREELPKYKAFQSDDVKIIAFEFKSPLDDIKKQAADLELNFPSVDAGDNRGEFAKRFEPKGLGGFPVTYVLDRQGKLAGKYIEPAQLTSLIEKLK